MTFSFQELTTEGIISELLLISNFLLAILSVAEVFIGTGDLTPGDSGGCGVSVNTDIW